MPIGHNGTRIEIALNCIERIQRQEWHPIGDLWGTRQPLRPAWGMLLTLMIINISYIYFVGQAWYLPLWVAQALAAAIASLVLARNSFRVHMTPVWAFCSTSTRLTDLCFRLKVTVPTTSLHLGSFTRRAPTLLISEAICKKQVSGTNLCKTYLHSCRYSISFQEPRQTLSSSIAWAKIDT